MPNKFVLIEASSENGRPRVSGLAYGGGTLQLGWMHPVVVDLAGMEIPETVPLLTNHENRTICRVGIVTATVKDNALEIAGEIISDSDDAQDIIAQGKAGADWQLSIGAEVTEYELVKIGSKRKINGQEFDGPVFHVQKSTLREVSVVAVGADKTTQMKVVASFNLFNQQEGSLMPEKSIVAQNVPSVGESAVQAQAVTVEAKANTDVDMQSIAASAAADAVKCERERISKIHEICAGEFPDIEAKAIAENKSVESVTAEVLVAVRAKRPTSAPNISVHSRPEGEDAKKALEAALSLRCGISADILEKSYGAQTVEAGMCDMDMPLRDVLTACMDMDHISYSRGFGNDTIRAAFSSVSLPGILGNVANKKLLQSFQAQPVLATKLCSVGDLNDFKKTERFRLTDVGDLLPVAPDGEIKDGSLVEEVATNQLETYGKKFCLTRQMIINDDLGAFMKVPTAMGNRAARLIDQLFFARLLANPSDLDGNALFSAKHRNLVEGAGSELTAESLAKAIQLFLDQVDADGQPISIEPKYLVVPTALKYRAIELTKGSTLIVTGAGDTPSVRPALNAIADDNLQVVSSPYLGNSAYAGNSQTGWYLFGDPRTVDTFEIGFLKGKRTPTIERGETDFNTLGMWFRVYFDLGIREQDFRGMVKSVGA